MSNSQINERINQAFVKRQESFIRNNVMTSDFIDFLEKNMEPYETLLAYYKCAIMEVETKFRVLDEEFSLQYDRNPIESIKSRVKSTESLLKKVQKRGLSMTIESIEKNITDIAGIRVVCSFAEDIYMLAECLLEQDDITLIERKDYIQNPKPSGYRSLHLIVEVPIFLKNEKRPMKVEVQLRTIAMDFWASVEHKLRYKKHIPDDQAAQLAVELLECADVSAALDLKMQDIRNRLAEAEIKNDPNGDFKADSDARMSQNNPFFKAIKKNLDVALDRNWKALKIAESDDGES